MPWRPITVQNITGRMTVSEAAVIVAVGGATSKLQERLTDSIAAFDSAMVATGHRVAAAPNMVDSLRNHVMAYAIGEFLKDSPLSSSATKAFWTESRQKAYADAQKALADVANKRFGAIEDVSGYATTGNWNSQNRIVMRCEPVVPPDAQFSVLGQNFPWYANPGATTDPPLDTVPDAPKNLTVYQSPTTIGQLILAWVFPSNAISFTIYRGTASGGESTTPIATLVYFNTWTDTTCSIGTTYYYFVTATNEIGVSANSNEAYNTSSATLAQNPPGGFVFA